MKLRTIVVVGGGYAGIHAVHGLLKQFGSDVGKSVRIVLLDKNPYHFRKVLLVKAPESQPGVELRVPFTAYEWTHVEFVQGTLRSLSPEDKTIYYSAKNEAAQNEVTPNGAPYGETAQTEQTLQRLSYDSLVLALGSVVSTPPSGSEGVVLRESNDMHTLKQQLNSVVRRAHACESPSEKAALLHGSVVGGGLTGVEIAAELAIFLKQEHKALGLLHDLPAVTLIHSQDSLLPQAPKKVRRRLEESLQQLGVKIIPNTTVLRYANHRVELEDAPPVQASTCVWALGTKPNPLTRELGLPVDEYNRVIVDPFYRVTNGRVTDGHATIEDANIENVTNNRLTNSHGIYAIGDCARVIDAETGNIDGMTCKEAGPQGSRLAKVIYADVHGLSATPHVGVAPTFCIGLGRNNGFVWTQRWGVDIVLTGKLGGKVREFTWNYASLLK